jgi:hypothetical protein
MRGRIVATAMGLFAISNLAVAEVVTLTPSKDRTLYENPAEARSDVVELPLHVGLSEAGFARRSVLAFDLVGQVPPGSQIQSAALTLHASRTRRGVQAVYLSTLRSSWAEGPAPGENDDSWTNRSPSGPAWVHPGGDYESPIVTACEITDVGCYTWGPTARMTQTVQQWVNNPASNFGWILIGVDSLGAVAKQFDSRENPDPQTWPTLTIHFTRLAGYLPPVQGDLNGDRVVDFADMAMLADRWLAGLEEPTPSAEIAIIGVGQFAFDATGIPTLRPDIFQPGHFSAFDVLAHLDSRGLIDMVYRYDESMATHVIDSINGVENWWYQAHYDGGKLIDLATRMDLYPCKERMEINVLPIDKARLDQIHASFASEVDRKAANGGQTIIPEVTILGKTFEKRFTDVVVRPHNLRVDTFREGVITAMDVVLSLADEDKLTCDLHWYDSIGKARVVRSFYLKRIDADAGTEMSGFQYETGADKSLGKANRISMPSDWRVLVSPVYLQWDWVSLE